MRAALVPAAFSQNTSPSLAGRQMDVSAARSRNASTAGSRTRLAPHSTTRAPEQAPCCGGWLTRHGARTCGAAVAESGANKLVGGGAGADRVGVEVRTAAAGVEVAAPRVVRPGPHGAERLARGKGCDAARRLGHDPPGARRALVARRVAEQIRTCKDKPQQPKAPVALTLYCVCRTQ